MKLLSCLLMDGWAKKKFLPHPRCKRMELSHISFVDGIMVFYRGEESSIDTINILSKYTGLVVKKSKTSLITSSVDRNTTLLWVDGMCISTSELPLKYLGLPLCASRINSKDCLPLIERITMRIKVWHARLLSFVGRVELTKLVLISFCIYWLSSFVLPKGILAKIKELTGKFIWEGALEEKKIHMVSMKRLCKSKEAGGLNIIDIE